MVKKKLGISEILNSDEGSQFTSKAYTDYLNGLKKPVAISIDGKGRAIDNVSIEKLWRSVKYECVYISVFEDGDELYKGLASYFRFYNEERLHESLGYKTPEIIFESAA